MYKRVIRPVYEELFEKADCWFEVAEVYKDGKPYKLNFKVVRATLTKKEKNQLDLQTNSIINLLSKHLRLTEKHIKKIVPLLSLGNCQQVTEKIIYLSSYILENWNTINDPIEYCTESILNELNKNNCMIENLGEELEENITKE